jgi:hypothetical protein
MRDRGLKVLLLKNRIVVASNINHFFRFGCIDVGKKELLNAGFLV